MADTNTTTHSAQEPPIDPYEWDLVFPLALYVTSPEVYEEDPKNIERFLKNVLRIRPSRKLAMLLRDHNLPPEQMPLISEALIEVMWGRGKGRGIQIRDENGALKKQWMKDESVLPLLRTAVHRRARNLVIEGRGKERKGRKEVSLEGLGGEPWLSEGSYRKPSGPYRDPAEREEAWERAAKQWNANAADLDRMIRNTPTSPPENVSGIETVRRPKIIKRTVIPRDEAATQRERKHWWERPLGRSNARMADPSSSQKKADPHSDSKLLALLETKGDLGALVPDLPNRQLQVVLLLVNDWLKLPLPATFRRLKATNENAMIALALDISETTVRRHLGEARLQGEVLGYDPSAVRWHPNTFAFGKVLPRKRRRREEGVWGVGDDLSEEEWEEQKARGRRSAVEAWETKHNEAGRQRKQWARAKGQELSEATCTVCPGWELREERDQAHRQGLCVECWREVQVEQLAQQKRFVFTATVKIKPDPDAHWHCSHGYDPRIHVQPNYASPKDFRRAYKRYLSRLKKELNRFKNADNKDAEKSS